MDVGRGANEEENDEEERLKVEKGRLYIAREQVSFEHIRERLLDSWNAKSDIPSFFTEDRGYRKEEKTQQLSPGIMCRVQTGLARRALAVLKLRYDDVGRKNTLLTEADMDPGLSGSDGSSLFMYVPWSATPESQSG